MATLLLFGIFTTFNASAARSAPPERPVVKPGMFIKVGDNPCTLGFLYRHHGRDFAVTAGHCVHLNETAIESVFVDDQGPQVRLARLQPGLTIEDGPLIGRVVYAGKNQPEDITVGLTPFAPDLPPWMDLAVIRLSPHVVADPATCLFGGPTGTNTDPAPGAVQLSLYGNGMFASQEPVTLTPVLPGRSGLGALQDEYVLRPEGLPAAPGDSGGPVLDGDGRAAATLTGQDYSPRVAPSIARAAEVLGLDLELQTAPLQGAAGAGVDPACTG